MKNKIHTLDNFLKEQLTDPAFRKEWKKSEPEYLLAKKLIEKRMKYNLSQRDLAKKLHTSQAIISKIETMTGNPSLAFLKRIAEVFDTSLVIEMK